MYSYKNTSEFLKNNHEFPYKSLYYDDNDKKNMFKNLQKYNSKKRIKEIKYYTIKNLNLPSSCLNFKGKTLVLHNDEKDYLDFNILSSLFIEKEQIKCKLNGALYTPLEYYTSYKKELAESCLIKYGEINPHNLRETLWGVREARECSAFRPVNLIAMVQYLFPDYKKSPIKILDPSSGWGDRLLGAMATKSTYLGVDPNTNLHPYYKEMINFYKGGSKYKLIESTFEDLKLGNTKYDLVFTSPPYFNLENYTKDSSQSDIKYSTEELWFNKFLKPYIKNAWSSLKNKGYMILVINQKSRRENYIHWMLDFTNDFADYLGVISYANPNEYHKSPQPMFIWQKNNISKILKTKRLYLRKFSKSDENRFIEIQSEIKNMENLGMCRTKNPEESKKQLKCYIKEYENETYVRFYPIMLKTKIIGYIGYYKGDQFKNNMLKNKNLLRILIDYNYRRKGYAKEIVHKFLKKYMYKSIHMMVEVNNVPSNKLFKKYMRKQFTYYNKKYYLYDSTRLFR